MVEQLVRGLHPFKPRATCWAIVERKVNNWSLKRSVSTRGNLKLIALCELEKNEVLIAAPHGQTK